MNMPNSSQQGGETPAAAPAPAPAPIPQGNVEGTASAPLDGAPPASALESEVKPITIEYKGKNIEVLPQFVGEKGDVNVGALLTAFNDTKTELDRTVNARVPEKYESFVPDEFKDLISADAPILVAAQDLAKEQGWSQEQYNKSVEWYLNAEKAHIAQTHAAELEALNSLYGSKAETTLQEVNTWADSAILNNQSIPENEREPLREAIQKIAETAAGVRLLDRIRSGGLSGYIQEAAIPNGHDAGGANAAGITEESLRALMATPAYWRDQDPETVEKVRKGFAQLYPN